MQHSGLLAAARPEGAGRSTRTRVSGLTAKSCPLLPKAALGDMVSLGDKKQEYRSLQRDTMGIHSTSKEVGNVGR